MPGDRRHEPGPASPAIMKPILTWRACDACITRNLEAECRHKQRVLSPDSSSEDEDESSDSGVASPTPPPPRRAGRQRNQRNQRDTKTSAEKPAARMRKRQEEEEESGDGSEQVGWGEGNGGGKERKIGRKRLYDEDDEEDEEDEDEEESRVAMRKRTNKARSTIALDPPDLEDEEGENHDTIEGKRQRRPRAPTAGSKTGGKSKSHLAKTSIKPPSRAPAPLSTSSAKWCRQSQRETFVDSVPKSRTTASSTKQKMRARLPISPIFLDALVDKTLIPGRWKRQTVAPPVRIRNGGVPQAVRISITPPLPDNAELPPEPVLVTLQQQEMESMREPEMEGRPSVGLGQGLCWKPSKRKGKQREQPVPSSPIPSSPSDLGMQSLVMEDGHADMHTPKAVEDSPGARSDDDDPVPSSPLRSPSPPPPSVPAAPSPKAHPSATPSQKFDRSVLENLRNPYPHLDPYAALPPGHQAAIKRWKDPERAQFNRWSGPMYAPCAYSIIRPECSFLLVPKRLRDEWEANPRQNLGGAENQQEENEREQVQQGVRRDGE